MNAKRGNVTTGSCLSNPYGPSHSERAMNRYGAQAMRHWEQVDPERYQAIPDKEAFFTALGEEAEREIQTRAAALAGQDKPGEEYLEKVGRLNMARFTAESEVLRELVLIPDPNDTDRDEEPVPDSWNIVQKAIQEIMWEEDLEQD